MCAHWQEQEAAGGRPGDGIGNGLARQHSWAAMLGLEDDEGLGDDDEGHPAFAGDHVADTSVAAIAERKPAVRGGAADTYAAATAGRTPAVRGRMAAVRHDGAPLHEVEAPPLWWSPGQTDTEAARMTAAPLTSGRRTWDQQPGLEGDAATTAPHYEQRQHQHQRQAQWSQSQQQQQAQWHQQEEQQAHWGQQERWGREQTLPHRASTGAPDAEPRAAPGADVTQHDCTAGAERRTHGKVHDSTWQQRQQQGTPLLQDQLRGSAGGGAWAPSPASSSGCTDSAAAAPLSSTKALAQHLAQQQRSVGATPSATSATAPPITPHVLQFGAPPGDPRRVSSGGRPPAPAAPPAGAPLSPLSREVRHADGKLERFYACGRKSVSFPNGTRKVSAPDGSVSIAFANGDHKDQHANGRVDYFYAEVRVYGMPSWGGPAHVYECVCVCMWTISLKANWPTLLASGIVG